MSSKNSFSQFTRRLLVITIVLISLLVMTFAFDFFLLLFGAILLAVFLNRTGRWIASHSKLSVNWSIAVFVLSVVVLMTLMIAIASPQISKQASSLRQKIPEAWQDFKIQLEENAASSWLIERLPEVEESMQQAGGLMAKASGWVLTFLGGIVVLLIILVLGLYIAFGADTYVAGLLAIVPSGHRDRARDVLRALDVSLHRWMVGRILEMVFIGICTSIGLWILGIPLPFALGLLAGLLTFIPNFGPIISVIPAMLLATQNSLIHVLYVAILYTVLQASESYVLTPIVQRKMISMPPALVIAGQILFGLYAGVLGVLLATPLIAAIIIIVKLLYVEDGLQEDVDVRM